MSAQPTDCTIANTPYLRLIDRGGWSFVQRTTGVGVVAIIAVTKENKLLLVEQYRPPLNQSVLELPAGIVGDLTDQPLEDLLQAAKRELMEEVGYQATTWSEWVTVASSAGLTDECVTLFFANDLEKVGPGGGDANENIEVHEIPLSQIDNYLDQRVDAGVLLDGRVYAAIYFLRAKTDLAF
ncbi:MAG: NUDIX hydrolase [Planctomycetota bacterium]|nr:NUDIX hydrolase [Planctomycetota bacterium]MEC8337327.1 NUDIX hydrolase [Planctomycetota bacterium]